MRRAAPAGRPSRSEHAKRVSTIVIAAARHAGRNARMRVEHAFVIPPESRKPPQRSGDATSAPLVCVSSAGE